MLLISFTVLAHVKLITQLLIEPHLDGVFLVFWEGGGGGG